MYIVSILYEILFCFFEKYSVGDQSWPIVDLGILVQHRVAAYSIHLVYILRPLRCHLAADAVLSRRRHGCLAIPLLAKIG
jgi:hypothetical protein